MSCDQSGDWVKNRHPMDDASANDYSQVSTVTEAIGEGGGETEAEVDFPNSVLSKLQNHQSRV